MKKVIIILCLCFAFTSFAAENNTTTKKSTKTIENVVSKKKVVKTRGKTENITKWTNWSKIKDLFM